MKIKHFAYLAGMIDGDGCIAAGKTFRDRSNCYEYTLKLEVNSKHRPTIDRIIELFGGRPFKNVIDGVLYWKWICQVRDNQRWILEGIIPYMVLKKHQSELALAFVNLGRKENPSERNRLVTLIQEFNQNPVVSFPAMYDNVYPYVAGLMDAEGTFTIAKSLNTTSQVISISNDSEDLLKYVISKVGGSYGLSKLPNHFCWNYYGSCKDKETFLLNVLPYLITKKEQAKILIEYVRLNKKRCPSYRRVLMAKVQALNGTSEANTSSGLEIKLMTESELHGDMQNDAVVTQ